jgi:hypothetical protein
MPTSRRSFRWLSRKNGDGGAAKKPKATQVLNDACTLQQRLIAPLPERPKHQKPLSRRLDRSRHLATSHPPCHRHPRRLLLTVGHRHRRLQVQVVPPVPPHRRMFGMGDGKMEPRWTRMPRKRTIGVSLSKSCKRGTRR